MSEGRYVILALIFIDIVLALVCDAVFRKLDNLEARLDEVEKRTKPTGMALGKKPDAP